MQFNLEEAACGESIERVCNTQCYVSFVQFSTYNGISLKSVSLVLHPVLGPFASGYTGVVWTRVGYEIIPYE